MFEQLVVAIACVMIVYTHECIFSPYAYEDMYVQGQVHNETYWFFLGLCQNYDLHKLNSHSTNPVADSTSTMYMTHSQISL